MEQKMNYRTLNHALSLFKVQILEGLPFAINDCPKFENPEEIFDWLKIRTHYKHDPKGVELFQTLPTLLNNNFHGVSGYGDCDCFTIAILTLLIANGFNDCGIVLVGRNNYLPVHIYAYVICDNKKYYLDLTNKYFNQTRYYQYYQEIPLKITNKEKKEMQLQLAENMGERKRRNPYRRAGELLKRQRNFYKNRNFKTRLEPDHVYLPSQAIQVREDYFDDAMNDGEFQSMLLSEGYDMSEIIELSGKRGERRRAKKDEKQRLKKEKKEAKTDIKKARAEKKRASGEAKITKAQAKQTKAERGGGNQGMDIFNKVVDTAKEFIPRKQGAGGEEESAQITTTAKQLPEQSDTITIFGKEIKKTTAYIGGGLGILALLGIGYAVTHKKK